MAADSLCARCAQHTTTCCQKTDIYVTPGDVERVAGHLGRRDFYEFRPPSDPVYMQQDDDPIWPRLVYKKRDGTRRVLKWQTTGDCTFLGPQGCVLPTEVRPLICRIYPFDFNEQGIVPTLAKGCPLELLSPGESLLHVLQMNDNDAEALRRQLYAELPQELIADDYRPDV
jgi:Fe-S-cluster containining protein